jgi:hypothetical protein
MTTVTYPFDPTGSNPLSRVTNEQHVLTSLNNTELYQTVIPSAAPFFTDNVIISFTNPDTSIRVLTEGVDYYFTHIFISAGKATAKPLAGSITFLDTDITGVLRVTYQTIGGAWNLDDNEIAEILANLIKNPRITAWEQITDLPFQFPVIDHEWNLSDMVGATEIVEGINGIRDAVLAGNAGGIAAHVGNTNNPHETTKAQVGLGSVENYPIATQTQAQVGTNNTAYMTPLRVAQAISEFGGGDLATHVTRTDNPHEVTKSQVGLGSVENYGIASTGEATLGTSDIKYMTPLKVKTVVDVVSASLVSHTANQSNPHNTTKSQIGLFNVQNYDVATAVEAQNGTVNDKYMTPLRVKQAITALASVDLTTHLMDTANPHSTTKAQVGLGSVDNFQVASQLEAEAGLLTNRFMTPQRVAQAVTAQVGQSFVDHLNATNPHGVTKDQVNLGNVDNYVTSSQVEAEAGDLNTRFMTPLRTKQAIAVLASGSIASHTSDTNNPHNTTKSQIGLGNVSNYLTADQAEAEAGNATDKYMTPLGTYQAISFQAVSPLNTHTADIANPHAVTKSQVGLGSVENYTVATQVEAQDGTLNDKYMTPLRVKQAIVALASGDIAAHTLDMGNPHNTTKTQVGLGLVENYTVASQAEAEAGNATDKYMTPLRTNQAIATLISGTVTTHISDHNNPHVVTKAQVGLGNVSDLSIASQAEAEAGSSNAAYMTPLRTYQAIAVLASGNIASHLADTNNPHSTTKTQVGLGNVGNFAVASQVEAEAGNATDKYMTPLSTNQAIALQAVTPLNTHIADQSNPHNTTKTQVGLGNVSDFAVASQAEAEAGSSSTVYMTPQRTAQAISSQVGSTLSTHVSDTNNPHNTTASQLGVYTTSQVDTALAGKLGTAATAANSSLLEGKSSAVLSSEITLAAIAAIETSFAPQLLAAKMDFDAGLGSFYTWVQLGGLSLDDTAGNENSPLCWLISGIGYNANEDIVGPNYSLNSYILTATIAENAEADDIIVNSQLKYLTSGGNIVVEFRQKIDVALKEVTYYIRLPNGHSQFSITNLNPHGFQGIDILDVGASTPASTTELLPTGDGDLTAHTSNTSNPHSTTKTQVGLGSVENYAIASQAEAEAGSSDVKYMTPLKTAQAITIQAGAALTTHTSNTSNPHSTTATQVGLGSVSNFAVASQAEAVAGTSAVKYMTPQRTQQAIDAQVGTAANTHYSDQNNPHFVNQSQVGLGNVQNYGIASQAQAEAGSDNATYMTPLRTKQAITLQVEAMLNTLLTEVTAGFTAISNAMASV